MKHTLHTVKKTFLPPYTASDIPLLATSLLLLIGLLAAVLVLNQSTGLRSNAAAISSLEAETGTLAGNAATGEDSSASGGQYIRLGSVLPPSTPTPTPSGPQLYLSTTGSDSNACTQTAPCKTFARANTLATAGTTIRVAPGTYPDLVRLTKSGTATARIRYVSDTKWGAKINPANGDPVYLTGHYTDFEGFDVVGNSGATVLIEVQGNYSRAIGNFVHNLSMSCSGPNGGAGIVVSGWVNGGYNGHHQEVVGNLVKDIGTGPRNGTCSLVHGIYAAVPYVTVANNVVMRSIADGITSWHAATNLTIVNNTSIDNGASGILIGNGDSGGSQAGNHDSYVANNISVGNAVWGFSECCSSSVIGPTTFRNNVAFGNSRGAFSSLRTGSTQQETLLTDPLFVNKAADDLHLQPTSPAINNGTSTNAPSTDIDGITRPQSAGFDRGAYER